ncbi:MAG: dTDP-4-dehydrorhamnose reductase [Gammaproteobacteria bacterium]|nr:dTDP-4-dehydrorhamnose reductase [Gammaproteobacteria bacterium]
MKVLITGANGQVGWELQQRIPDGYEVYAVDVDQLDIRDELSVNAFVDRIKPDLIINAAAYTAVDKAESDKETAYAVNAYGAGYLAASAKKSGARLIHISTDFVFDGAKSTPYTPEDKPNPLNVYGASKLEGERLVAEECPDAVIIRTAWVYSVHGNNFVKTMLRLMRERDELSVVCDQIGTPTWAGSLASAIWEMADRPKLRGIYHYTDAGVASWYDFAVAIQQEALAIGLLSKEIVIKPIAASEYFTPARRPSFGVLDKKMKDGPLLHHWQLVLKKMLGKLLRSL